MPWPGGQITYFNAAADQAWAVAQAVNAWNRSGARVRFVRTTEAHAQLRIVPFRSGKCYAGADATTGYVRRATIRVSRYHPTVAECGPYTTAIAADARARARLGARARAACVRDDELERIVPRAEAVSADEAVGVALPAPPGGRRARRGRPLRGRGARRRESRVHVTCTARSQVPRGRARASTRRENRRADVQPAALATDSGASAPRAARDGELSLRARARRVSDHAPKRAGAARLAGGAGRSRAGRRAPARRRPRATRLGYDEYGRPSARAATRQRGGSAQRALCCEGERIRRGVRSDRE